MVDFGPLLRCPESFLSRAAAAAVVGLRAELEHALKLAPPDDPGRAACLRVLEALGEPAGEITPAAPVALGLAPELVPAVPAIGGSDLSRLFQTFCDDPAVRQEVGTVNAAEARTAPDRWWRLHVLLLRASPRLAQTWRERAREAAGPAVDLDAVMTLPGDSEAVFPGLSGLPEPVGLRLAPDAPLDPRLGRPPAPWLEPLVRVATIALWAMEHDPYLCHALRAVNRFGVTPNRTNPTQRAQVEQHLVNRYMKLIEAQAAGALPATARAWVDLDEVLNSLLHVPAGHDRGWWRGLQKRTRDATALDLRERVQRAGHEIYLVIPAGRYADAQEYTNPADDKPLDGPVPPGDVVACLKVYMKINGTAYPGRVLYRPR